MGSWGRDRGISLERVTHTRAVQYGMPWVTRGDLPHLGDVCQTPSADLGKSRQGFAIMHPYQYGVKGG